MMMKPPVIIIGAGRSGTNILRDVLCRLDDFHTWPCDELNYVWRSGNRNFPTDALRVEHATRQVKANLNGVFKRQARKLPQARIVEKTCANSLRVSFVDEVLPQAQFVQIVRDGRDVSASAMARWTASLDLPYIARKARYLPPRDLPHYAFRYLRSRWSRWRSPTDRLSWWGPRFEGMEEFTAETPLAELVARQWAACVTASSEQLATIAPDRQHTISYQALANNPERVLAELATFLGSAANDAQIRSACSSVNNLSVGAWRTQLSASDQEIVRGIVEPRLEGLGIPT